jgi:ornithine carbamoyltransferase
VRADQLARIDAAFEKGIFDTLAGDYVNFVDADGVVSEDLLCVLYNLKMENKPGLNVDESGLQDKVMIEMLFSKNRLETAKVVLDVAGHWLIDGKRFDFAKGEEIQDKLNAVGGLHNLIACRVTESTELNQTTAEIEEHVPSGPEDQEPAATVWEYDLT